MHPMIATGSVERKIRDLMFDSLLGVDINGKIQPSLAESWTISTNGRLYTFNLRRGVKFHDGREMTGEDVKYSVTYAMNPKNGTYGQSMLAPVERIETEGKYVIKMFLKKASPPFLASLTDIQPFTVVPKESLPEGVNKLERSPPGTGPLGERHRVATGPALRVRALPQLLGSQSLYRPSDPAHDPGRNDQVHSGPDRGRRYDKFTPFEWVKQVADGKIKGLHMVKAPYASFRRMVFNVAAPPFNNKKMRQAIAYAIDKKELMHAALFGYGDPGGPEIPGRPFVVH